MREAQPDGSKYARFVLVAARPGKHEVGLCSCSPDWHHRGIGLVGPSGSLLWNILARHGVSRGNCYVTNVRKDFSNEHSVPTDREIEEVIPSLRDELEQTSANIIVALGREALFALCGKQSIEQWRGSVIESTLLPGRKVIATWHPAAALRTPQWSYVIDADLRRAVAESAQPKITRRERRFIIDPPLDECVDRLRDLKQTVAVDVETFGNDVSVIGLADKADEALVFPTVNSHLKTYELVVRAKEINKALQTKMLVGQNVMFDVDMLESNHYEPGWIKFDTMLAHHLLWPELGLARKDDDGREKFSGSHDLAFLVSVYTDHPYYKHFADEWRSTSPPDWHKYWVYNGLDVCLTYEIYEKLQAELEEFNQVDYYRKFVNALIRPVLRMQRLGLQVDNKRLVHVSNRISLEAKLLQTRLDLEVGFDCNVRSTTDLRYLLHDVLKLPKLKLTKKGDPSTDEDTLKQLAFNSPHADIFRLILDIRKRRTLTSSFLHLETNDNGRYTARYKIHGTDPGRLSSVGPGRFSGRKGPQLQNVPKQARQIFIAKKEHSIVVSDLRRAEAMFVAYDAGDEGLIELFNDPTRDLYKEEAASALSKKIEDITKVERDIFKQVTHATNYGMRERRLVSLLRLKGVYIEDLLVRGITGNEKKAKYLIDSYLNRHPAIPTWQKETWAKAKRDRTLLDGLGRRRFFMGRKDDHMQRVVLSYRPQATIVGVTNRALILLDEQGWFILLQVHDSLGIECKEDDVVSCVASLEDALRCPIEVGGRTLIIPTDTSYGNSWGVLDGVVAEDVLKIHRETRSTGLFPLMDGNRNDRCSPRKEGVL